MQSESVVVSCLSCLAHKQHTRYEVRLKSECMDNNDRLPKKLREFYSEPMVGLIDKTPPKVFGLPQPSANLAP